MDGFLCWLLPVSPCTVTIHSSSTSLALDYVITLPTTTTTQGAGGDILQPHTAAGGDIHHTAQTPAHLIFVFNPSTTFKHFITIYIKCVLLPMKQNIIIRPRPRIPCSYLPLNCKHKAKYKCDYYSVAGVTISPPAGQHLSSAAAAGWPVAGPVTVTPLHWQQTGAGSYG